MSQDPIVLGTVLKRLFLPQVEDRRQPMNTDRWGHKETILASVIGSSLSTQQPCYCQGFFYRQRSKVQFGEGIRRWIMGQTYGCSWEVWARL